VVKIPDKIKEFIENQGIFAVGTVGGNRFANVSPKIFFTVDEDAIYWLDFFKHKSCKIFSGKSMDYGFCFSQGQTEMISV